MDPENIYPYKSVFAANLSKVSNEDLDQYISKASLDKLKPLMPLNVDLEKNSDLIACVLNAAVAGRKNQNGDGITSKSAIRISENFINKYVNIGHKKDLIKGCIVNAGFSKFGSDELISKEQAEISTDPFNISIAFVLWKTTLNKSFISLLEDSVDPTSGKYKQISGSWEILFKDYDIAVGDKNIKDAEIVSDEEGKSQLEKYLQSKGGTGEKDGKFVYRVIKGETNDDFLIPAGIGLVENPAADVRGLEIVTTEDRPLNQVDTPEKQQFISQTETVGVIENNEITQTKFMDKITKIEDINNEVLKQSNASNLVHEFITQKIQEENIKFIQEQGKVKEAEKNLQDTQAELKKVQTDLSKIQAEMNAKAAQELFTQRMTYFDDTYEISPEERQAIASEIKDLDNDTFEKAKNKFDIFLKEKSKAAIEAKKNAAAAEEAEAAKKKANPFAKKDGKNNKDGEKPGDKKNDKEPDDDADDADADDSDAGKNGKAKSGKKCMASDETKAEEETALEDALKNGKAEGAIIPNAGAPAVSFMEKYAEAFKPENCIEVSKR
jgi:hypothetical protein